MSSGRARRLSSRDLRCCAPLVVLAVTLGCKSDLSQQLLERELRYQEDQIYSLQDELQLARLRLERTAEENSSLRRQLGVDGPAASPRPTPARVPAILPPPVAVPPAVRIPDGGAAPPARTPTAPPIDLAPPALEGVPPLPQGAEMAPPALPIVDDPPLALPPAAATVPATRVVQPLAFEAPVEENGRPSRLVINRQQTQCVDADSDGRSEGLVIVFEPRNDAERLVTADGDVHVTVYDATAGADPTTGQGAAIARWQVPAAEAAGRFRRTSRQRGVSLSLPWQAEPPTGEHVRVHVTMTPASGPPLEADATIPTRITAP
jgi:hypothetical protein